MAEPTISKFPGSTIPRQRFRAVLSCATTQTRSVSFIWPDKYLRHGFSKVMRTADGKDPGSLSSFCYRNTPPEAMPRRQSLSYYGF